MDIIAAADCEIVLLERRSAVAARFGFNVLIYGRAMLAEMFASQIKWSTARAPAPPTIRPPGGCEKRRERPQHVFERWRRGNRMRPPGCMNYKHRPWPRGERESPLENRSRFPRPAQEGVSHTETSLRRPS